MEELLNFVNTEPTLHRFKIEWDYPDDGVAGHRFKVTVWSEKEGHPRGEPGVGRGWTLGWAATRAISSWLRLDEEVKR